MDEPEMRRAIGLMVDKLADAAFGLGELDRAAAQDLLRTAGLTHIRPATEVDVEQDEFGDFEVGDDFHALTDFAVACRDEARS